MSTVWGSLNIAISDLCLWRIMDRVCFSGIQELCKSF